MTGRRKIDPTVSIDEAQALVSKYSGTETNVIPNLLAAAFFFSPNLLQLFPGIRANAIGYFMFYNFVIMFVMISGVSMFRFRYAK